MAKAYNPNRTRKLHNNSDPKPFKLSRSKIEYFLECPYCFYLDCNKGIKRPPGFPFTLNQAVDTLLKKEFDGFRGSKEVHPLIKKYNTDAKPAIHEQLQRWRTNAVGIQFLHTPTNFLICGAIDDLWQNSKGEYIVVDYKATSRSKEIVELNEEWQGSYKRQMEVYQWLLRKNELLVSNTGYFVYCNGKADRDCFNSEIKFDITLIAYEGNDAWVEDAIQKIHDCLSQEIAPDSSTNCQFCNYRQAVANVGMD